MIYGVVRHVRISLLVLLLCIAGCDSSSPGVTGDARTTGRSNEDDSLASLFEAEDAEVNDVLDQLAGLRYFSTLSRNQQRVLREVWLQPEKSVSGWNRDLAGNLLVRILLAEILWKYDPVHRPDYRKYVLTMSQSEDQGERAAAALSLGFIGQKDDIDLLVSILLSDDELPAIQAGFGLIAMENPQAYDALNQALGKLSQADSLSERRVYDILKMNVRHVNQG